MHSYILLFPPTGVVGDFPTTPAEGKEKDIDDIGSFLCIGETDSL